jgi:hypothetical protein
MYIHNGWMDGWMDEWMGGWMDGLVGGWVGGWMDGWMYRDLALQVGGGLEYLHCSSGNPKRHINRTQCPRV